MNSPVAWALLFHILGFVFWLSGLLVATQVLASHVRKTSPEVREVLRRLELKMFKGIAHPGAAVTVMAGVIVVIIQPAYIHQAWLQAKLCLVAILVALDLIVYVRAKGYHAGRVQLGRLECKVLHSAIAVVFLGILVLVMIKPI